MLREFKTALIAMAALGLSVVSGQSFCSVTPRSYTEAMSQHPEMAEALKAVASQGIATWYTDDGDYTSVVHELISGCYDTSQRVTIIVYGLPNKDCDASFSNNGSNQNKGDYLNYIRQLVDAVGNRPVLYVFEPDAVGLLADAPCAQQNNYEENMAAGIELLASNPNADIYTDVGYWTLTGNDQTDRVAKVVKKLSDASNGKVKGVTLNTSNYRPNAEMSAYCANFKASYAKAGGNGNSVGCIVDSSRNFNDNPTSTEWCNANFGGIGRPPTSNTGIEHIDFLFYGKIPGESDGECNGQSADSMIGPGAGQFFPEHFKLLWNNGYFVSQGQSQIYSTLSGALNNASTPSLEQMNAVPETAPSPMATPRYY